MPQDNTLKKTRYPGILPFEPDDHRLFYGRSNEIEELFNLIKIKPFIVLFGKSGLGKTSLLKAGVGPLLQKHNFYPMVIRLGDTRNSPVQIVLNELKPFLDQDLYQKYGNKSENKIWEYLKAASFLMKGTKATPVLIFDQFEELFNHPLDLQIKWSSYIGDIVSGRLPSDIEDALFNIPRAKRNQNLVSWYSPPLIKIVFAIRSDRMSELHKLHTEIPAILHNRYELKPLYPKQAKAAIEKPAALESDEFITAPFSYSPEAIQKIDSGLSNNFDEIESAHLQIICQYVEEKVKAAQEKGKKNIIVTPDYLGDHEGIQNILNNYYKTQINLLGTKNKQHKARKLLEEGLIAEGRRISLAEVTVKQKYKISDALLKNLLDSRLIRPEDTRTGRTYEISHDKLVDPILREYRKKAMRIEINKVSMFIAVILSLGFSVYANYQQYKSKKKQLASFEEQQKSYYELQKIKDSLIEENEKLELVMTLLGEEAGLTRAEILTSIDQTIQGRNPVNSSIPPSLIQNLYAPEKLIRSNAITELRKDYRNHENLIPELLKSTEGKINQNNAQGIYNVIYILENSEAPMLKKYKSELEAFLIEVKAQGLSGPITSDRINNIQKKY